jgi:hypothetical protein
MGLINCSECLKEISDKAKTCPHCGNPLKENAMDGIVKNITAMNKNHGLNNAIQWVDKYFVILSKSILILCILLFAFSPFYKLANREGSIHKATIINILSDYRPEEPRGTIRSIILDLKEEVQMAHTTLFFNIRGIGFPSNWAINPFIGNFFNILLILLIVILKVRREIYYRWIFVLSLMILYCSLSIRAIGLLFNRILVSRYSELSISFSAQNRLLFLSIILLIISAFFVFRPIFINYPSIPAIQKLKKWLAENYTLNLAPFVFLIAYILLGNLMYIFAIAYLIYIIIKKKKLGKQIDLSIENSNEYN